MANEDNWVLDSHEMSKIMAELDAQPAHRVVRVRPSDERSGWLILKEPEFFEHARDAYPDIASWTVEFAGTKTDAELDALPEFDGW